MSGNTTAWAGIIVMLVGILLYVSVFLFKLHFVFYFALAMTFVMLGVIAYLALGREPGGK